MGYQNCKVSIVVPFYNAADFIKLTVESVLLQTHTNWELLLVNDGSTDNSAFVVKKYVDDDERILLLEHTGCVNKGVSKSRELGVKNAKGEFIAFLDADDLFFPNKLNEQLSIFSKIKDIILIHSRVELLNNTGIPFGNNFILEDQDIIYDLHKRESWLKKNEICNSTVIVKSKVLKDIQFGLPQLFQYEDWLLWSIISQKGNFFYQNEPQIKYRIHPKSATSAILKNKLIAPYSKIEYFLSFYHLTDSNPIKKKIITHLKDTIIDLLEIYSDKDIDEINSFGLDIHNMHGEGEMYYRKYNDLLIIHSNLQKEFEELNRFKKSKSYKLIKKLKFILNMK